MTQWRIQSRGHTGGGGGGAFHETCYHWQFFIHWQTCTVKFLILIGYEALSLTVAIVISEWQIVSDDKFHEMPPSPPPPPYLSDYTRFLFAQFVSECFKVRRR